MISPVSSVTPCSLQPLGGGSSSYSAETTSYLAVVPSISSSNRDRLDRAVRMLKGEAVAGLETLSGDCWTSARAIWLLMGDFQNASGLTTGTLQGLGAVIRDLKGAFNLTPTGTMTWGDRGTMFDGTASNRLTTAAAVMPTATPWSVLDIGNVCGWAAPYPTTQQYIGAQNANGSNVGRIVPLLLGTNGKIASFFNNGTGSFIETPGVAASQKPRAAAASHSAGGVHSLYLDGNDTAVATNSVALGTIEQTYYQIGGLGLNVNSFAGTRNIHIVWSEALSGADLGKIARNLNVIFNLGIIGSTTPRYLPFGHYASQIAEAPVPASGGSNFYGSPAITVDPSNSDRLVAYHDAFGTGATTGQGFIYESLDRGATWSFVTNISNAFWGCLFWIGTDLYILATTQENGSLVVRRSVDGGATWSAATTILAGNYHKAPTSYLRKDGYLIFGVERVDTTVNGVVGQMRPRWTRVVKVLEAADLLNVASWSSSNELDWADIRELVVGSGYFLGNETLEHAVYERPNGSIGVMGRTLYAGEKASTFNYDLASNILTCTGASTSAVFGASKFEILKCPTTGKYIAVGNKVQTAGQDDRTKLCVFVSDDSFVWTLAHTITDLGARNFQEEAAQYPSAVISNGHLYIVVRLAFNGAKRFHDAQRIAFWKVADYVSVLGLTAAPEAPEAEFLTGVGTSTTAGTSTYNTSVHTYSMWGESYLAWAHRLTGGSLAYLRDNRASGNVAQGVYHFGIPASSTALQLSNGFISAAIGAATTAPGNAVLVLQVNRNDLGNGDTAAACITRLRTIMDMCDAAGVYYILCQDPPRLYASSGPDEAPILTQRLAYNEALITEAITRKCGLCMWGNLYEDPGNPGYALVDSVDAVRPGHPRPQVGYLMGKEVARNLAERFVLPGPPSLNTLVSQSLTPNPLLTGTGGSGGGPTDWQVQNLSSAVHTKGARIPHSDGSGAQWYPITITSSPNNLSGVRLTNWSAITTGFVAGDIIEVLCEVRTPNASGWNGLAVNVAALFIPSFRQPQEGYPAYTPANPPVPIVRPDGTLLCRSMPLAVPSGTTGIEIRIECYGLGEWQIAKPVLVKNQTVFPTAFSYP